MSCEPVIIEVSSDAVTIEVGSPLDEPVLIEVGVPGPAGPSGADADYDIETDDDVVIGQPMYLTSPAGHLALAQADGIPQARVFGLATEDQSATVSCKVKTIGKVTRSDWTPVTGAVSLVPGDVYYLDASTPGRLTTTAPQTPGEYVTRVGIAATLTTMDIHIMRPLLKT